MRRRQALFSDSSCVQRSHLAYMERRLPVLGEAWEEPVQWCNYFINDVVVPEEYWETFWLSRWSLVNLSKRLRGQPHGNACVNARFALFWPIIHMDPVNAVPVNKLFWNLVSGWKIWKHCLCALVWAANPHTMCIDDTIALPLDL